MSPIEALVKETLTSKHEPFSSSHWPDIWNWILPCFTILDIFAVAKSDCNSLRCKFHDSILHLTNDRGPNNFGLRAPISGSSIVNVSRVQNGLALRRPLVKKKNIHTTEKMLRSYYRRNKSMYRVTCLYRFLLFLKKKQEIGPFILCNSTVNSCYIYHALCTHRLFPQIRVKFFILMIQAFIWAINQLCKLCATFYK